MSKKPAFKPQGFHTVNPYFAVGGAARFLDFLSFAFGAEEVGERFMGPDGSIMHAAAQIGDSMIEVSDFPDQPTSAALHVYVEDADAHYRRAIEAGAESLREPTTTFYGERSAGVRDPWGNSWWIGCHVEDVSPEEMSRRMAVEHEKS